MNPFLPPVMWHAFPPEVHSTLLSTGATPAGVTAAGLSWTQLAATYIAALSELEAVLMTVQANYQGPSAEQFVAAHLPMVAWLASVIVKATEAAAAHAAITGAYETALVTMPTMPELITNHVTEATLVGTNFLGCNTVPIALTQADYQRMWIQAGTVMAGWDSASTGLVDGIVETMPSPVTLIPGVGEAGSAAASSASFITGGGGLAGGGDLTAADLLSTKLAIGKAASAPASIANHVPGQPSGPEKVIEGETALTEAPENMASGSLLQSATSLLSSGPQAAMQPAQMLMSAPQSLASAPQQLSGMLGQFLGSSAGGMGQQSALPVGFSGTSPVSGINPAGMTSMAGGAFGGGPSRPMLPSTWGSAPSSAVESPTNAIRAITPASAAAAGSGGAGNGMMGHGAQNKTSGRRQVNTYTDTADEDVEDYAFTAADRGAYVMTR